MVCVSWSDTIAYVDWLNSSTGVKFRLPSAAEWEYAARRNVLASQPAGDIVASAPAESAAATPGRTVSVAPREWVGDCAVTSGINVTPGSATQAAGSSCKQRTLIVTGGSGTTRETRPPDYSAANLGFRLAL